VSKPECNGCQYDDCFCVHLCVGLHALRCGSETSIHLHTGG
jgi:hypothetical protein